MKKIIIAAALFATATVIAGPFGFSKGMTLEELKKQGKFVPSKEPFIYTAKTVTNGHPDFESYSVIITPQQGLCKILATGRDLTSSSFGTELENKHKNLINVMSKKYGAPADNYNFLHAGSIWKEPQYWMIGLLKKERNLSTFWIKPDNKNLPDSIQSITVKAVANSASEGYIELSYEFDNFDQCIAVLKAKENSSL